MKTGSSSPRLARGLLAVCLPEGLRDAQLGDLEEELDQRRDLHGQRAAVRWYWSQTLRSLAPALACRWRDHRDPLPSQNPEWRQPRHQPAKRDFTMETLIQDLRYGLRSIGKSPGFALIAILTLSLGIGVNSAIFTIVSAIAFADMPVTNPENAIMIWSTNARENLDRELASPADYFAWREQSESFAGLSAFQLTQFVLTGWDEPMRVTASRASDNSFSVWGLHVAPGRDFLPGEEQPGAEPVAILAHGFWQRRLGGDPSVVGTSVLLDGVEHAVVGVASPRIEFGDVADVDIWVPLKMDALSATRDERSMFIVGRLKDGVSVEQARQEVSLISTRLAEEFPTTNRDWSGRVVDFSKGLVNSQTWVILTLLGVMVGFVLLIACINVANMLMSRATIRQKEFAVRAALGAGRRRILRQLLTESLVIALGAAALGLVLAQVLLKAMGAMARHDTLIRMLEIDRHVMLFTLAITLLAPLLFGLMPSIQAARADIQQVLRDGAGALGGRGGLKSRGLMVAGQVAMAVMLMVTSVLVTRSVINIQEMELGFDADSTLTLQVQLPETEYASNASMGQFFDALTERAAALPGVLGAGVVSHRPLSENPPSTPVVIAGRTEREDWQLPRALRYTADAGFFTALELPLLRGRYLKVTDTADSLPVAVISEGAARQLWPAGNPLGERVRLGTSPESPWIEIVGVVRNLGVLSLNELETPQIFVPFSQQPSRRMSLMIHAAGDPSALASGLRQVVWGLDPNQPVEDIRTMAKIQYDELATNYVLVMLFLVFAGFALFMSAIGLYGVTSYSVSQRTQEIGIRIALGAGRGEVARMVLRQGILTVGLGTLGGLLGAWLLGSLMRGIVFGISVTDPLTYLSVPAVLIVVATVANLVPATRAARIDPVTSLRVQ